MIEIQEDMKAFHEFDLCEKTDPPVYSLFIDGNRVFSFENDIDDALLLSRENLLESGDLINLGWGFEHGDDNWLERQGSKVILSHGERAYGFNNQLYDERVVIAEIPFEEWTDVIDRFAILLNKS
jgi:hypothetical protein